MPFLEGHDAAGKLGKLRVPIVESAGSDELNDLLWVSGSCHLRGSFDRRA